jgi:TPR repeat protein
MKKPPFIKQASLIPTLILLTLLLPTLSAWSACPDSRLDPDNKPILSDCLKAAKQGDPAAQVALGSIYFKGEDTLLNYKEAYSWYQKAAEQGSAHAMFNIGVMHDKGYHVDQDFDEAARWYRKAAELDFPEALFNIGLMYEYGQSVPKDLEKAHEYYLMAAEKGDPSAQFSIGVLYDKGLGVEQNLVTAYMWWDITGEGYIHAQHNRESLAEEMTPMQISEAKRLAELWRQEHAHVKQLPPQEFLPGFE